MTRAADDPADAGRLAEADKAFVWHPFTAMGQWLADDPLIVAAADRFELIDTGGRRYIDGFGSLWCNLHGHRVGQIDEAIRRQLDSAAHTTLLGFGSPPSIELATRLVEITPAGLKKVFYSDSGATAVEVALKMAFQYYRNVGQDRRRFLALRQGYHGDTVGSVSLGGIELFHGVFGPLLFDTTFVDCPNPYRHPAGEAAGETVLGQIDEFLGRSPGEYCAVVMEPLIQAAGGMLTHPQGFLASVRELTRRHDVLLIADEVATGFCRTGRLFACEHEGVEPDLMCLGKGLTGGYLPVAATMTTQEIFDAFRGEPHEGRTFYHGHTYTGNALGCAAAVASIDLIFSSGLPASLPAKVDYVRRRLGELADHPHVGDIRQCGLMVGIELVADRGTKRPFDPRRGVGAAVCGRARGHGLIIRPLGDVIVLMPAPAMDAATLERMMSAVVETVNEHFRADTAV
ncbi:MAG TPA: adenosylmethionine--8-amino-7-oxononanoate transaminase [Phycisphaerae bacterium]|nr:adenosylmethionine--8-amino-7-oxononanoate transaminase [Phycisphaerae bacterium]HUT56789.1 adenosylmethionine--8-amino-7-oxononanoate transaminase [Phycisphaerae bacterium]